MATLQEKLNQILTENLPGTETELETLPNGHVCGHVISSAFIDKSYEERRQLIRGILDARLDKSENLKISTLLTYTPTEWSFEPEEATNE